MGFLDRVKERNARHRARISGKLDELSQATREGKERIGEKANEFSAKRDRIRQEQSLKRESFQQRRAMMRERIRRPQTPQQKKIRSLYSTAVGVISAVLILTHTWPVSVFERWGWRIEGSRFEHLPLYIATGVCVFLVLFPIQLLLIRKYAPNGPAPEKPVESPVESETGSKEFLD